MNDFELYWKNIREEIKETKLNIEKHEKNLEITANHSDFLVNWIHFDTEDNNLSTWGWWASPKNPSENMNAAMIWLPGYSYGTPSPDQTCLIPGISTFCINVHGRLPDEPYVNPAGKNDYILEGISSQKSYIYRKIILRCLFSVDVVLNQRQINENFIFVGGMSQGGALAILTAACRPECKICFADMPFLADIENAIENSSNPTYRKIRDYLSENASRKNEILSTLKLFDPVNFAEKIKVPIWLSSGGRDPAVKPKTVEKIFDKIENTSKEYHFFENAGHVFLPEMNQTHTKWIYDYISKNKI
jgi:cephalosporin-C deacetylase